MHSIQDIVRSILKEEINPKIAMNEINSIIKGVSDQRSASKYSCGYRLCRSLIEVKNGKGSWQDFLGHLRQYILFFKEQVFVSQDIAKAVREFLYDFNLTIDGTNEINALKEYPNWFENPEILEQLYQLKQRRYNEGVTGDGILYKNTGNLYYKSLDQKVAVRTWLDLPHGHTLLVSLPTGGGKSLIGQMPIFTEKNKGTTIVVVPTVALAMDQERSTRKYFKDVEDKRFLPRAYYGGLSSKEKKEIFKGVEEGTIPLLFTSPEAILNGAFHNILLDAAKKDKVNRLVIDECHIVVDWGVSFRTEFQFLSTFRRKLLEASNRKVKTLLLSATLTDESTEILGKLFSEENNFLQIRGDALRPEIMYWLDKCDNVKEREEKILRILPLLPRPIIIYVKGPSIAKQWKDLVNSYGFTSVKTFSGNTPNDERGTIIKEWEADELDIIIATSAFGMGVDKRDIRTVIHCYMPESINRFYQEVGRGGRDGFPSISLWSVVPYRDEKDTRNLINPSILTTEKINSRWEGLFKKSLDKVKGDTFWINVDAKPFYLEGDLTGNQSANWNEFVILFLYRKGLIDIEDIEIDSKTNRHKVLVKLKNIWLFEKKDIFIDHIAPLREEDRELKNQDLDDVKSLIESFDEYCWARTFTKVYSYASECCGGCPHCRKKERKTYRTNHFIDIIGDKFRESIKLKNKSELDDRLKLYLGFDRDMFIYFDPKLDSKIQKENLYRVSAKLIKYGVKNIITPTIGKEEWKAWVEQLPASDIIKYGIYSIDEILENKDYYMFSGPIAVLYSSDSSEIDKIYRWSLDYINEYEENQVIYVGHRDLWIRAQKKPLQELVSGICIDSEALSIS